jgi:hypothetical protein
MRITLDEQDYTLKVDRIINAFRNMFLLSLSDQGLTLPDGTRIALGNSPIKPVVKALITPKVLPVIQKMYAERGMPLELPKRHEDVLAYAINALADFYIEAGGSLHVVLTSEISTDYSRNIISITTARSGDAGDRVIPSQSEGKDA